MRRIATLVYQKNKRYKQAIELAQHDKMYKEHVMKERLIRSVRTAWTVPWPVATRTWRAAECVRARN